MNSISKFKMVCIGKIKPIAKALFLLSKWLYYFAIN
ncbi:hypothetical protein bsdtw1_01439 [Clostridium fungisolvens]|uniref:Uncharacterized protein n=1 Tax=Clostridium fungisolvens TaxID=1604897 RepID=A0A6V8SFV8_9CLOT|nr:hypothetical protein bsdtw1_01439 [Clostridium fungisolvens]